jgi:hypothetical protein
VPADEPAPAAEPASEPTEHREQGQLQEQDVALAVLPSGVDGAGSEPDAPTPARSRGPIRFRRPLPPGCKAPTAPPPAHPGRPPR